MPTSKIWSGLALWSGAAALVVAGAGGVSYAAPSDIPDDDGDIKLCFNKNDANSRNGGATLRIFNPGENDKKCAKKQGDKFLEIESEGEQGLAGPQGPPGAPGVPGAPGGIGLPGATGPSQIPVSGVAQGGLPENQIYFPSGISSLLSGGTAATAAFAFTITDFSLVTPALNQDRTFLIRVGAGGPGDELECVLPANATTCDSTGELEVAAGETYALYVPSVSGNNNVALAAGSRYSYTIEQ